MVTTPTGTCKTVSKPFQSAFISNRFFYKNTNQAWIFIVLRIVKIFCSFLDGMFISVNTWNPTSGSTTEQITINNYFWGKRKTNNLWHNNTIISIIVFITPWLTKTKIVKKVYMSLKRSLETRDGWRTVYPEEFWSTVLGLMWEYVIHTNSKTLKLGWKSHTALIPLKVFISHLLFVIYVLYISIECDEWLVFIFFFWIFPTSEWLFCLLLSLFYISEEPCHYDFELRTLLWRYWFWLHWS